MKVTRVKTLELKPNQCRAMVDPVKQAALTASIKALGLQVPLIVVREEIDLRILDGHMRWEAHKQLGLEVVDAIILDERPSAAKLRILQLVLDVHKSAFDKFERADLLKFIMDDLKCTVTELAEHVGMKQPLASKLLPLAKMSAELREILKNTDQEKCYYVAVAPSEKQLELAMQAAGLTRDQLRGKARGLEPKTKSARFGLPSGFTVIVQGRDFALKDAIAVMLEAVKELRSGLKQGLDITTAASVMRDKAKAH